MGANEKHEASYHCGEYVPDEKQLRNAYLNVFIGERNETSNAEFNRAIAKIKAEAWDACARSIVYEDGTPVEIMSLTNPYK